jgi:DNA-binding MarR family transcriptional regulator
MTVLALIGVHQGISQSALAKQLGVNRAAMVKVIDALELQQLIERSPTDGDRRSYSLLITSQGQSKLKVLQRKTEKYEQALTQALTEPERQLLMSLLDKVGDGASSATSEI